jgi:hypothetical protein
MEKDNEGNNILARDKAVSVGIDVHKRSWHLTAVSDGVVLFKGTIPLSYEALHSIFGRFINCRIKVAYEAGPSGFGMVDQRLQGTFPHLVHSLLGTHPSNALMIDCINDLLLFNVELGSRDSSKRTIDAPPKEYYNLLFRKSLQQAMLRAAP